MLDRCLQLASSPEERCVEFLVYDMSVFITCENPPLLPSFSVSSLPHFFVFLSSSSSSYFSSPLLLFFPLSSSSFYLSLLLLLLLPLSSSSYPSLLLLLPLLFLLLPPSPSPLHFSSHLGHLCQAVLHVRSVHLEEGRERLSEVPDDFLVKWMGDNLPFLVDSSSQPQQLTTLGKVCSLYPYKMKHAILNLSNADTSFEQACSGNTDRNPVFHSCNCAPMCICI